MLRVQSTDVCMAPTRKKYNWKRMGSSADGRLDRNKQSSFSQTSIRRIPQIFDKPSFYVDGTVHLFPYHKFPLTNTFIDPSASDIAQGMLGSFMQGSKSNARSSQESRATVGSSAPWLLSLPSQNSSRNCVLLYVNSRLPASILTHTSMHIRVIILLVTAR